jgi:hypothetical protein
VKFVVSLSIVLVAVPTCTGKPPPTPSPRHLELSIGTNERVTRDDAAGAYRRFDGKTDAVLKACSTSRFPQNEPSVAIDPRRPKVIVVGANESCPGLTARGNWVGFYRSTDGGSSWSPSLVPGYPGDVSVAGKRSPASRLCAAASDPTLAFDLQGRLFFGFVCVERKTLSGSTMIALFDEDAAHYVRTIVLARGRPARGADLPVEQDKINVVVDQTTGPTSGSVYAAWTQFAYQPRDRTILVASSADHGTTFSSPVVATRGQPGLYPDLAIGPTGNIYLTFRSPPDLADAGGQEIGLTFSPNGGRTFAAVARVATIRPFDSTAFSGGDQRTCGAGRYRCRSGFTFPRFISNSAVAADDSGVHLVWAARLPDGQSKIFLSNSPDGVRWTSQPLVLDPIPQGHQFFPEVASAAGVITVVFYDTRGDSGYSPDRPPGNDSRGRSTGNSVDVFAAVSADGGQTWTVRRMTTRRSNMDYDVFGKLPFFGDYLSVSAVPGTAFAVWTDTRDLRPGSTGGFQVASNCPTEGIACITSGVLDQNIYGAVIGEAVG